MKCYNCKCTIPPWTRLLCDACWDIQWGLATETDDAEMCAEYAKMDRNDEQNFTDEDGRKDHQ